MKLYRKSRNLIPFPYKNRDYVEAGLTVKANSDGGVSILGTATRRITYTLVDFKPNTLPSGTYYISGRGINTDLWVELYQSGKWVKTLARANKKFVIDWNGYDDVKIFYNFAEGANIDEIVYPMLNEGDTALPYEPYAGLRVKLLYGSKNLFDEKAFSGLSYVTNDTYNGEECYKFSATATKPRIPCKIKAGTTVTFSLDIAMPHGIDMYWFAICADGTAVGLYGATGNIGNENFTTKKKTVTFNQDCEYIEFRCYAVHAYPTYYLKNIMLNKGTTAQPYDKYFPLSKMNLYLKSRNLIPFPYSGIKNGETKYGITYIIDKDGVITANGVSTGSHNLELRAHFPVTAGQTFSFSSSAFTGKTDYDMYLQVYKSKEDSSPIWVYEGAAGRTYTIPEGYAYGRVVIHFEKGAIIENVVFKPMLSEGETILPFEPPQEYPN